MTMGAMDGNIIATIMMPHKRMYSPALATETGRPIVMLGVIRPRPMSPISRTVSTHATIDTAARLPMMIRLSRPRMSA